MTKVFVLGLDGVPSKLIFEKWKDQLPNITKLMENGCYATLMTRIPPSTIAAWTSLCSGKDPSDFGIYSYTKRVNFEYKENRLINSGDVKCEMIWDIIAKKDMKTIALHVPLTYPVKKINGIMVSDFLTPEFNDRCTYPAEFKEEIRKLFGDRYMFDVDVGLASYKSIEKHELLERIFKMTDMNFKLIYHLLKTKEWDLFIAEIIGTDRILHTFFSYIDETHRNYQADNEFKEEVLRYFKFIDMHIGKLLGYFEKNSNNDNITFIVASDHGMAKMDGRINLNDWLIKNGYLAMKKIPLQPIKLNFDDVDWKNTKAFAVGAYFGRIYFNMKNREPEGIVTKNEYNKLQDEIIGKLTKINSDDGRKLDTKFFKSQDVFKGKCKDEAPDMIIYFDNLIWGVNNDVGNSGLYSYKTTKGSDDAGHAPEGIFIMHGKEAKSKGNLGIKNITDVTPTILKKLGLQIPKDVRGKIIE